MCDGEEHLLRCFLDYWIQNFPDILTGWNVDGYDVPYICGRLERLFGEKEMKLMSPWGIVKREEIEVKGREQIFYRMLVSMSLTILIYIRSSPIQIKNLIV